MITVTYILLAVTGILVIAAAIVAFRSRRAAMTLIGISVATCLAAAIFGVLTVNGQVSPAAYEAVKKAAAEDAEVDAVAQWALEDKTITPSEYGEIAIIYREKTHKDLRDLLPEKEQSD